MTERGLAVMLMVVGGLPVDAAELRDGVTELLEVWAVAADYVNAYRFNAETTEKTKAHVRLLRVMETE